MPALKPTEFTAEIVWLGVATEDEDGSLRSKPLQQMNLTFAGPEGEVRHGGRTRASCSRVSSQHPRGTEIVNERQLSILSQEELDGIAADCGLDSLDPGLIGASLIIRGIPDFTHVPPSSRLQAEDGATVVIDMENRPCIYPGQEIETEAPGHGKAFKAAAKDRRGVTAWVQRPGMLRVGATLRLHIPDQRAWAP